MEFALIIKLILVGMMLFSALSYLFQRSEHKQNLQEAIESHHTTRVLTDDEFQLLKPYLDDKSRVKPYKYQSSLVNNDVTVITGACVRHSLTTNGAESSYYFVIGNIEVFFPYGMDNYTVEDNSAEVVFTKRYAFVVSLNGYDLAFAKKEQESEILRNEQWSQGSRGQFKTVTNEESNHIAHDDRSQHFVEQATNLNCEILEQRDETPLEIQRRNLTNTGFISSIILLLAVMFSLIYERDEDLWLLVISAICLFVAALFYFHKPKTSIRKVNRVKGTVEAKDIESKTILIGDSLALSYPTHWKEILPEKTIANVDMDVTVEEKELIRYGHVLSLSKEIEQYGPPKFWGRNCFIFVTGMLLSMVIYLLSSSLSDDAIFSYRFLTGPLRSLNINDQVSLKQMKIQKGDLVDLNVYDASCDVSDIYQCKRVFIIDKTMDDNEILMPLPDWVTRLSTGKLIITLRDDDVERLEMYEQMLSSYGRDTSNYYYYNNQKTYTKLLNIGQLVLLIDEICETENSTCVQLKDIFTSLLTDEQDEDFKTWSELLVYAEQNKQSSAFIYASLGRQIEQLFSILTEKSFGEQEEQIISIIENLQRDPENLIINFTNDYNARVNVLSNSSPNNLNSMIRVDYYRSLAIGLGNLKIYGFVNHVDYNSDGSIASLSINADYRYKIDLMQLIPASLVTITIFTLLIIITVLQLFIWLWKMNSNKRRLNRIKVDYRTLIL